jgi:hypothetical protein
VVDAFVFFAQVVAPVPVEVTVGDDRPQLEDRLGAFQAPPRPCDAEAAGDDVAAGAFDDSGSDRPALCEGGGVVQVGGLGGEAGGAGIGAFAFGAGVAVGGGAAADAGGDGAGVALQDLQRPAGDPFLGVGVALVEE